MSSTMIRKYFFMGGVIFAFLVTAWLINDAFQPQEKFNGARAYQDILTQVNFGPRVPGSDAHAQTIRYIQQELLQSGWKVQLQQTDWLTFPITNIIANRSDQEPQLILGAHYDSRIRSDQDQDTSSQISVPGANDGASGVAVLLELSRVLAKDSVPVWLVFFDAEDNGGVDGRQWIMGSRAFVSNLKHHPEAAIIVDMVGDTSLNIYFEVNSNLGLSEEIWTIAGDLGYEEYFITHPKFRLLDDHIPFIEAGIPAADIIDFDYPYWHTSRDLPDKVSETSLQIVGETLLEWINRQK